ncbi:MAG: hypothetical protein E7374_03040 [Clostridiales bacterium]|nr:hypothetical protein [Clostridiales bacterium]
MKKTNAERFIQAYNKIDYSLRTIYNFKRSMAFNDVVRRSVLLNSVVRKYEEDLIDFGRLRNAIIHSGNNKYVIAEPHDEVVDKMEKLAEIISEPPFAVDRVGNREVITIEGEIKIASALELIYRTGYANLPIYIDGKLASVLNARKLVDILGKRVGEGINLQDFISNTSVAEVIPEMGEDYYFMIADEKLTIDAAMNAFEGNRKLLIILITKDGKSSNKPLKIISSADIIDMKRILDIY